MPRFHEFEITLDRFQLGGDAHELRSFDCRLAVPPRDVLPPPFERTTTGVVVR